MYRLSEQQYRNTIADIFGEDIEVAGHIRRSTLAQSDVAEYERMARGIASQVVDDRHRAALVGCVPRDLSLPDDACSANFFRGIGRFVFRRPLSQAEVQKQVAAARDATGVTRDFYSGLGASLATMLVSPRFLFDIDVFEADRAKAGTQRLDAYSKASRLSLFLSNTSPDSALLEAAEHGELHTAAGVTRQIDRLLASPRTDGAIDALLSDAVGDAGDCALPELVVLQRAVRNNLAVPVCLAAKISEYALRRPLRSDEAGWAKDVTARFVKNGYQVRMLVRDIATSDVFFRSVQAPETPAH
jgi:hypothetical protein